MAQQAEEEAGHTGTLAQSRGKAQAPSTTESKPEHRNRNHKKMWTSLQRECAIIP